MRILEFQINIETVIHIAVSMLILLSLLFFTPTNTLTLIYYIIADIGIQIMYYKQLQEDEMKFKKFIRKRSLWLKNVIKNVVGFNSSKNDYFIEKLVGIKSIDTMGRRELGLEINNEEKIILAPDIEETENELVKIEERASFLMGATVFLPVLFGMMHIFRYVEIPIFLIELQITVLLAQLITRTQTNAYQVNGWNDTINRTNEIRDNLINNGRKAINSIGLLKKPFVNELGLINEVADDNHAVKTVGLALNTISQLPVQIRLDAHLSFFSMIKNLPKQEKTMQIRWNAYKIRLLLISTIGVAISALLSGIAQFNYNELSDGLVPISSTPYLNKGMMFLSIIISLLVMKAWLNMRDMIRWTLIWLFTFLITNNIINSLFI